MLKVKRSSVRDCGFCGTVCWCPVLETVVLCCVCVAFGDMGNKPCFALNFGSDDEEVFETQSDCDNAEPRACGDLEPVDECHSSTDDSPLNSSLCQIEFDNR